jgi:hypothetical protein
VSAADLERARLQSELDALKAKVVAQEAVLAAALNVIIKVRFCSIVCKIDCESYFIFFFLNSEKSLHYIGRTSSRIGQETSGTRRAV